MTRIRFYSTLAISLVLISCKTASKRADDQFAENLQIRSLITEQIKLGDGMREFSDLSLAVERIKATPVEGSGVERENQILDELSRSQRHTLNRYLENVSRLASFKRKNVLAGFHEAQSSGGANRHEGRVISLVRQHYEAASLGTLPGENVVTQDFATLHYALN